MTIRRIRRPVARARLERGAASLLDAANLCAISTVNQSGGAHVSTAYFAWGEGFSVVWLSHPAAAHSRNLRVRPATAIAVYDSGQVWGEADRGIQLFGTARELSGSESTDGERLYVDRFPAFRHHGGRGYRFYELRPRRVKLFDEAALGGGTFVTARVDRDRRLVWQRTEVYASGEGA